MYITELAAPERLLSFPINAVNSIQEMVLFFNLDIQKVGYVEFSVSCFYQQENETLTVVANLKNKLQIVTMRKWDCEKSINHC